MNAKLKYPNDVVIAKDIPGYEGLYMALSDGRIWSCASRVYLTPTTDQKGYKSVKLYKDGEWKQQKVHRIILSEFVPQPKEKDQVNHIDGVKANNSLDNLEWVTGKENMRHAFDNGLEKGKRGENHNMAKLKTEDVVAIRKLYASGITQTGKRYTQRQLAKMYGVRQATIWGILHRENWAHV